MVLSWILNSLEPKLADSVLSCDTPHAIWKDLHERFSLGNAPCIFQVQRDIYKIKQGQQSVVAYYIKLKGLWDELASFNSATLPALIIMTLFPPKPKWSLSAASM